jgi:hypothetical protein
VQDRQLGKKSRSLLENDADTSLDGVYVSTRALIARMLENPDDTDLDSSTSSGVSSTSTSSYSLAASSTSENSTDSGESSSAQSTSWKTSGTKDHNKNSPLIVNNLDEDEGPIEDEALALGIMMARSRRLPGTWYYSSNHILVNQERSRRTTAPLIRHRDLDELARAHAQDMADAQRLFHKSVDDMHDSLQLPCRRLGANVAKGKSIREIHYAMMRTLSDKNNMLDRRFTHMGMGTAKGPDGELYLCQVYRG